MHNFCEGCIKTHLRTRDSNEKLKNMYPFCNTPEDPIDSRTLVSLPLVNPKMNAFKSMLLATASLSTLDLQKCLKAELHNTETSLGCLICVKTVTNPVITPRKHIFCQGCIEKHMATEDNCFVCKEDITCADKGEIRRADVLQG